MKWNVFSQNLSESHQWSRMLLVANVALALSVAYLAHKVNSMHERLVLTPTHLDKRMEIGWQSASLSYYKTFAFTVANAIGSIGPDNKDFVLAQLASLMSKTVYAQVKPQLLAYVDSPAFKRGATFTYFTLERLAHETGTEKIFASGYLRTSPMELPRDGAARAQDSKAVTYEMQFQMNDGRPVIVAFDSYEGLRPHDEAWKRQNAKRLEREAEAAEKKAQSGN